MQWIPAACTRSIENRASSKQHIDRLCMCHYQTAKSLAFGIGTQWYVPSSKVPSQPICCSVVCTTQKLISHVSAYTAYGRRFAFGVPLHRRHTSLNNIRCVYHTWLLRIWLCFGVMRLQTADTCKTPETNCKSQFSIHIDTLRRCCCGKHTHMQEGNNEIVALKCIMCHSMRITGILLCFCLWTRDRSML